MILDQDGNISLITQDKATIVELVKKIQSLYPKFKSNNIVISLSSLHILNVEDLLEFLELSNSHRATKQSFVIVTNKIDLDSVPEELVVVPTVQEAYDIIEMEEMERDLDI